MAFTVLLGVLWQICRIQHGTRPISSLTLRPWRVVLICLITVSAQAISNGKGIDSWANWFAIERLNKLTNVYFGLTLSFEKHILSLFMIYQSHLKANQLDVMKDTFRKFEKEANRNYWIFMISVTVVIFITILLTYAIEDENQYYSLVKICVNLVILGVQGVVLRQYIETTNWFLRNMKRGFHYEYKRHVVRETLLFILMLVSFSLCDLSNLLIYANDMSFYLCTVFNQTVSLDPTERSSNSLCRLA